MKRGHGRHARLVWSGVVVLAILHWDFWNWNDPTLVLGFMPVGLFYHAVYSLAAGLLWFAAVKYAWPEALESWAEGEDAP